MCTMCAMCTMCSTTQFVQDGPGWRQSRAVQVVTEFPGKSEGGEAGEGGEGGGEGGGEEGSLLNCCAIIYAVHSS